MTTRARSFMLANAESPIVYGSVDGRRVTYRLENGKTFRLNADEASAAKARWAFA